MTEGTQYLLQIAYNLAAENRGELRRYMDLQVETHGPLTSDNMYFIYDRVDAIKKEWARELDEFNASLGLYRKED